MAKYRSTSVNIVDGLGLLDAMNLDTLRRLARAPGEPRLTADTAIRLAIWVAASVAEAGELERFRPNGVFVGHEAEEVRPEP